jgi:serine/threonine-protein phosphatase 5
MYSEAIFCKVPKK